MHEGSSPSYYSLHFVESARHSLVHQSIYVFVLSLQTFNVTHIISVLHMCIIALLMVACPWFTSIIHYVIICEFI